jgi:IMP dehydrogenase
LFCYRNHSDSLNVLQWNRDRLRRRSRIFLRAEPARCGRISHRAVLGPPLFYNVLKPHPSIRTLQRRGVARIFFIMIEHPLPEALTFDDVLLTPAWSEVAPAQVSTATRLTKRITLNTPLLSAAMDTVTESRMAIAMAQQGGLGIVHRNLTVEQQAGEIDKVKRSESGMIVDPVTVAPEQLIGDALEVMRRYKISGVPVTRNRKLVGILTNRDLRFETRTDIPISEVMTKTNLITVPVGTTLEQAEEILHQHRVEKLLVVSDEYELKGLITVKDIQKKLKYPNASKDSQGRLRVGAAIGATGDFLERAAELVRNRADVLAIDSAHGHSSRVLEAVREVKKRFPEIDLLAGNVATREGAEALIEAGADAVKVGIGPGSICTTRMVTGAGMPQITAISEAFKAASRHGIPLIADGGIKYSGDITKAVAAGASVIMIGSLFAGVDESPGETILYQGRSFKTYRGMGSLSAMAQGGGERYFQGAKDLDIDESNESVVNRERNGGSNRLGKFVPEGIEGRVPYRGALEAMVYQLVGGLRSGMGYCGAATIEELQKKARFVRISSAGLRESHVHDVVITREAPNYHVE